MHIFGVYTYILRVTELISAIADTAVAAILHVSGSVTGDDVGNGRDAVRIIYMVL